jgi:succinyl-CoA synthetase beta subunit
VKLQEYQAKRVLAAYDVPVPCGEVASSAVAVRSIAERLGQAVVVKAQVLVGGRGKAGGIVRADMPEQAAQAAERLLGSSINGELVRTVLIEPLAPIAQELYLGLTINRQALRIALVGSADGGVDIEETARLHPEHVHTVLLDPLLGLRPFHSVRLARAMDLARPLWPSFAAIASALYRVGQESDALLVEVNPLVVTTAGTLLALDAKMVIDDNALSRQKDRISQDDVVGEGIEELTARQAGITYIKLAGHVGCMVNGAGLAMATMDLIKLSGGEPANFLDIGGGARAERVETALRLILTDPQVRAVLVNIFGGITRCDEVARGILRALEQVQCHVPLVVRLVGTNEAEGRRILEQASLTTAPSLAEGARVAVAAAAATSQGV